MTALFRTPSPAGAPSGRVINALLQFADVQEDLGGGRIRMRLSRRRLGQADVRAALGADAERAADLAVVYDEREAEVVDVTEDATSWEEELYEFTKRATPWNSYAHARKRRHPERFGIWS